VRRLTRRRIAPSGGRGSGRGDLIAKTTAPAWTPLFARAAAIATDGGTLAAHASLVAREYGIPAVVGTGDITQRLRTGQLITVDGTAGTITVHCDQLSEDGAAIGEASADGGHPACRAMADNG
jgi:phosphohistidine swiveling domain-containing protein